MPKFVNDWGLLDMSSEPMKCPDGCVPLASLCDRQRGITYGIVQPGSHTDGGVPILRAGEIENGRISSTNLLRVAENIEASYERSRIRGGEVLLTLVGAYFGKVAVTDESHVGMNTARAVGVLPVIDEPWYVAYALMSPFCQAFMQERATTTAQPTLNLRDVASLPIPWPNESVRHFAAETLRCLDRRLEIISQTNATLESLAQVLFKSWFVDFDPVRAKADGRAPEGMDSATAALFPAQFEESALGLIPQGWVVQSLDSFATYLNGLALQKFPAESEDEFLPVIKIAQLRAGNTDGADRASARLKPEYVVKDGDVLFSWSGSLEVEFWCGGTGALNQHLFKVTSETVPDWFCYLATKHFLPGFREIAAHKATTMGHIQRKHLTEAQLALPPSTELAKLGAFIGPLLKQKVSNSLLARELAALRDALLPRLITGQFSLEQVREEVAVAVA